MAVSSPLAEREPQATARQVPDPSQQLLQMATAYVPSAALWVAAELKIADLIGSGSKPVAELARHTKTNEDELFRILRLLAMEGSFFHAELRRFALTPPAELLLSDPQQSMRDTVAFLSDPLHFKVAAQLPRSVRTRE